MARRVAACRHGRGGEAAGRRRGLKFNSPRSPSCGGHPLEAMAFPAVGMPAFVPLPRSADLPTVYAVARQESEFIWHAASGAGAKGLMQMLPSTAVVTARRAGVEFDPARLIVDPAFNTQLGAALLGQLIEDATRVARACVRCLQRRSGSGRSMDRCAWRSARRSGRSRRLDRAHSLRRDARLRRTGQREPRRLSPALRRREAGAAAGIGASRARVGGCASPCGLNPSKSTVRPAGKPLAPGEPELFALHPRYASALHKQGRNTTWTRPLSAFWAAPRRWPSLAALRRPLRPGRSKSTCCNLPVHLPSCWIPFRMPRKFCAPRTSAAATPPSLKKSRW